MVLFQIARAMPAQSHSSLRVKISPRNCIRSTCSGLLCSSKAIRHPIRTRTRERWGVWMVSSVDGEVKFLCQGTLELQATLADCMITTWCWHYSWWRARCVGNRWPLYCVVRCPEPVTPYQCRLGDLLCFVFIVRLVYFSVIDILYLSLQYFDTVGWVFWPVKTVSHITYTVLAGT